MKRELRDDKTRDRNNDGRRGSVVKIIIPILIVAAVFSIWIYKNSSRGNDTNERDTSEFALDATADFDLEQILSYGLPTMIVLGTDYCPPCLEMMPIIEKVNKDYRERAMIKYVDVDKNPQAATHFGLRVTPTQFFLTDEGEPYGYHEGFLSEEEIIRILGELGVK